MGYCKICSKKTVKDYELCSTCENKRKASKIILKLQDKINFEEKINNTILYSLGYTDFIRIKDLIWTLEETNLINKVDKDNYTWIELDKIEKFVKKYDKNKGINLKINSNKQDITHIKCQRCGQSLTNPKKKQKYCKKCKKINKTLKNIKFIQKYDEKINITDLIEQTQKEPYQIEGIIFDLIENDLIKKIDDENYQQIPERIEIYLQENDKKSKVTQTNEKEKEENEPEINIKLSDEKPQKMHSTPSNEEIFNEFFEKYIKISTDDKNWISYDQLYNIFTEYAQENYQLKIPELGTTGFNTLINSKIKKTMDAKIKYHENITEFNIIYTKENKKSKETDETLENNEIKVIDDIKEVQKLLLYFINNNLKILNRKANSNDLTKNKIFDKFNEYLLKNNQKIENEFLFSQNFQDIIKNIHNVNQYIDKETYTVHYNLKLINSDKKLSDNNKDYNSITNNEIFDEFIDEHMKIIKNDEKWIKKQRLYHLLNSYSKNKYNVEIPENGINGFNSILQSKKRKDRNIKERIHLGKIEYNLEYKPENDDNNLNKLKNNTNSENKSNEEGLINSDFEHLEEYFDRFIQISGEKVDTNDVTKKHIYNHFNNYHKNKYGHEISYVDFTELFIKLLSKHANINTIVDGSNLYCNVKILEENNDVNNPDNNTKSNYNQEMFDEYWNDIQIINNISDGKSAVELYENFKKSDKDYNLDADFGLDEFKSLLSEKIKERKNIKTGLINGKLKYNLDNIKIDILNENSKKMNDKEENKIKIIIPNTIKEYFINKNITEFEEENALILVYNEIITDEEYISLIKLLNDTKDYVDKINISRITEEKLNVNIEFMIEKKEDKIPSSSQPNITSQKEVINKKIDKQTNTLTNKEENVKKNKKRVKKFTLADHKNLKPENASYNLFNILNEKILDIDDNIKRDVLKYIIGYKVNKRFVDLIIRKSSLTISLYVPIDKIEDPKNICRDITNKGSWTNGLIDFKLYQEKDVEYAMNLIIQSYEYIIKKDGDNNAKDI